MTAHVVTTTPKPIRIIRELIADPAETIRCAGDHARRERAGGLDWTHKYPPIAEALRSLGTQAYLDGELCGVFPDGITSFGMIPGPWLNRVSRRRECLYHLGGTFTNTIPG
jgi:hypothetical protein